MDTQPILRAAVAGLTYFAVVFAAGFALGMLRVLFLIPRVGEIVAVLLELPVMLALSWVACRWLIVRLPNPTRIARMVMGGLAFTILMGAEFGISTFAFGRSISDHLNHYRELSALLGLVGQIASAAFPVLQK